MNTVRARSIFRSLHRNGARLATPECRVSPRVSITGTFLRTAGCPCTGTRQRDRRSDGDRHRDGAARIAAGDVHDPCTAHHNNRHRGQQLHALSGDGPSACDCDVVVAGDECPQRYVHRGNGCADGHWEPDVGQRQPDVRHGGDVPVSVHQSLGDDGIGNRKPIVLGYATKAGSDRVHLHPGFRRSRFLLCLSHGAGLSRQPPSLR